VNASLRPTTTDCARPLSVRRPSGLLQYPRCAPSHPSRQAATHRAAQEGASSNRPASLACIPSPPVPSRPVVFVSSPSSSTEGDGTVGLPSVRPSITSIHRSKGRNYPPPLPRSMSRSVDRSTKRRAARVIVDDDRPVRECARTVLPPRPKSTCATMLRISSAWTIERPCCGRKVRSALCRRGQLRRRRRRRRRLAAGAEPSEPSVRFRGAFSRRLILRHGTVTLGVLLLRHVKYFEPSCWRSKFRSSRTIAVTT
jgi:hypothetical protein